MIDGHQGTRISKSTEKDGSMLMAAINEANRGTPGTPGKVATSVMELNPQSRASLRKTAEQIIEVIEDEEATHIAIEIHGE